MNGNNLTRHILLMVAAVGLLLSCAGAGERARMAALLEKVEQMDQDYLPLDTVTFMEEVLDFYMAHGNEDERIRANYMMGGVYRDRGDSPMALEYYLKAVNQADTTDENCNFKKIGRIYGQMADLFHKQRYPQKEISMWDKAIFYSLKDKDTLTAFIFMENKATAFHLLGDDKTSKEIYLKTYKYFVKNGNKTLAASSVSALGARYLNEDSLDKAKKAIDEYLSCERFANPDRTVKEEFVFFNFYLGKYYEKKNILDSALFYYYKLIRGINSLNSKENGYRGLMSTYGRLNKPDSAIKYANLFADANDTSNIRKSASEISRADMLFNYSEHQKLAARKSLENNRLKLTIYCSILIFIIISIIVAFFTNQYLTAKKNKLKEANKNYTTALNNYLSAAKELKYYKENKLAFEENKQKEIEELRNALAAYQTNSNIEQWSLEQDLLQHPIVQTMHNYACKISTPAESEWKDLSGLVEKMLPEFYRFISDPLRNLTEKEFYICILTRLQFLPSEVAALMNFSKQRVTNLRSRTNKKLFANQSSKGFDWNIHHL